MNRPLLGVILRWTAAVLVGAGGVYVLARVLSGGSDLGVSFGKLLGGLAAVLTGLGLVAPELVRWTVAPISSLIDSVLMPSEKVIPPADLKLARFYWQSQRFDESAEEYARILQYHPDHVEAYLEGIRAAGLAGDEKLAKKLYQGAQRVMQAPDQHELLESVYATRHAPLEETGEAEATPEALPEEPDATNTQST